MQKHDGVKRRHINAFRKTSRIGKNAAGVLACILFQPFKQDTALLGVICSIDMIDLAPKLMLVG